MSSWVLRRGESAEQFCERVWVFDHREVPAGNLDWLDCEHFVRDEPLPFRVKNSSFLA
jgi:hypothetical protein